MPTATEFESIKYVRIFFLLSFFSIHFYSNSIVFLLIVLQADNDCCRCYFVFDILFLFTLNQHVFTAAISVITYKYPYIDMCWYNNYFLI